MLAVSANVVFALVFAIVGAVLAVIDLAMTNLKSIPGWAILSVAVAVILLTVKAL